jgi:adenosylcobyric acid synthase
MKNKSIMIQGTGSSVGKSILCTALCRIFTQDGYRVNPFKSQNMSNNSYITHEGHEMGRAQVMQAEAAGRAPLAVMNPILLKPSSDQKSQVVLKGKAINTMEAKDYFAFKSQLKDMIRKIYYEWAEESDIVVIEGAGSPAEINLKQDDLVNMGMAKIARAPVVLVGDIDKGGVFASLAGTMLLLDEDEKSLVKGVLINKFRGDLKILEPGLDMLEEIIKVPVLGVVPYFHLNLEDEDSVTDWEKFSGDKKAVLDAAVIRLPHISNFTDFNVLRLYEDLNLRFVEPEGELGQPDIIIIPGTKATVADLRLLRESGMAQKIINCHQRGSIVFGICGGFQILGEEIRDPHHVESPLSSIKGLGLINSVTTFQGEKTTTLTEGLDKVFHSRVKGYEIHMGETQLLEGASPLIEVNLRNGSPANILDGAVDENKTVFGTYFHGIFDSSPFTRAFLNQVRAKKNMLPLANKVIDYWQFKEEQYDKLAEIVRHNIDLDKIYKIVEAGIND